MAQDDNNYYYYSVEIKQLANWPQLLWELQPGGWPQYHACNAGLHDTSGYIVVIKLNVNVCGLFCVPLSKTTVYCVYS